MASSGFVFLVYTMHQLNFILMEGGGEQGATHGKAYLGIIYCLIPPVGHKTLSNSRGKLRLKSFFLIILFLVYKKNKIFK